VSKEIEMGKADLVKTIADRTGHARKTVEAVVDELFAVTRENLKMGESVQFVGFGKFEIKRQSARVARNPRTGEQINVAAKDVVKFKPGSDLAAAVA
jgi:DNA-binding protein HU-beta